MPNEYGNDTKEPAQAWFELLRDKLCAALRPELDVKGPNASSEGEAGALSELGNAQPLTILGCGRRWGVNLRGRVFEKAGVMFRLFGASFPMSFVKTSRERPRTHVLGVGIL